MATASLPLTQGLPELWFIFSQHAVRDTVSIKILVLEGNGRHFTTLCFMVLFPESTVVEKWELSLILIWKTNEVIERLFLLSSHQPLFSVQCKTGSTRTAPATVRATRHATVLCYNRIRARCWWGWTRCSGIWDSSPLSKKGSSHPW